MDVAIHAYRWDPAAEGPGSSHGQRLLRAIEHRLRAAAREMRAALAAHALHRMSARALVVPAVDVAVPDAGIEAIAAIVAFAEIHA